MKHSLEHNYQELTTAPIPKLIIKMAVPTIVSMMTTAFYNLADTYFVGQINTQATAAVGIVFPAMAIVQAIGFFFGHGSGNYISRRLGAKDSISASRMAATGFFLAFAMGVILTLLGIYFLHPLSVALGSTPTILPYTTQYLGITLIGAPFMTSALVLNNQLRFQGYALYSMFGIVTGAIINVCLDPILIFTFKMGVAGAAWATVTGQICSFILLLLIANKGNGIAIHPRHFTLNRKFGKEIIGGGTPSLMRQALASISTILLNVAAAGYSDAAVAAMSIVARVGMLINSFFIGFGQGYQPVCGFNYGASLYHRVRAGFKFCVRVGVIFLTTIAVFGLFYAEEIIGLFRQDPAVIAVGGNALRWQLIAYPFGAWTIISNMMLQTIRKSVQATLLSSARQGLFFIPLIYILPAWLGLTGVEMCQAISDLLTFLLAVPITLSVLHEIKQKEINASPLG